MGVVEEPSSCPECSSAGSVYEGVCEVCLSGFGRDRADLLPTGVGFSLRSVPIDQPILHPSIPMRFADVIAELKRIADLATGAAPLDQSSVRAACRRAESLLRVLRRQFLEDVAL